MPPPAILSCEKKKDAEAEELRLQGNDAFATQDFSRALELYKKSSSVHTKGDAKTYANMAATLCKLGRYEEAAVHAKRATVLDSKWAKGWWRRGVVMELHQDFLLANKFFQMATELDPKQKIFKRAFHKSCQRLGIQNDKKNKEQDLKIIDRQNTNQGRVNKSEKGEQIVPTKEAYLSIKRSLGGCCYFMLDKLRDTPELSSKYPTSKQFLFQGIIQWIGGMQTAIANLALSLSSQAQRGLLDIEEQVQAGRIPNGQEGFVDVIIALLGGLPSKIPGVGAPHENLASGLAFLGGININLEIPNAPDQIDSMLAPPPRFLNQYMAYQALAVMNSIDNGLAEVLQRLGDEEKRNHRVKLAPAIIDSSKNLYTNLLQDSSMNPHNIDCFEDDLSPQDCVDYVKELLQRGYTWNNCVRRYIAIMYKGSIIYGFIEHMMTGIVANGYRHEKWAIDFIDLLDEEFNVKKSGAYEEKGSSFRESFQIGILMSNLHKHEALRGHCVDGAYPMSRSLDLCIELSNMANRLKIGDHFAMYNDAYIEAQWEYATKRKALILAHSNIGSILNTMREIFSPENFKKIIMEYDDFFDIPTNDCEYDRNFDPYVLAASHYKIAAENELEDAEDAPIYWWAYAGLMARSDPNKSGFTLGMLKDAMRKAREAELARDVNIFGPADQNVCHGSSYQTLVTQTAMYFRDKDDSFVLPQIEILDLRRDGKGYLLKVDNEVLCDFEHTLQGSVAEMLKRHDNELADVQREHGQSFQYGVPTLEVLCIRALHKSGCEFAKGENDGAVIQHKAMMVNMRDEE